jgi:hypothetical protein
MRKKDVKRLTKMFNNIHYVLEKEVKDFKAFMPYHRLKFEIPNVSRVQIVERFTYSNEVEIATRIDNLIDNRSYEKFLNPNISMEQLFKLSIKEEL